MAGLGIFRNACVESSLSSFVAKSGSRALTVFLPALQDKVSLAMSHMDLSNLNSEEYMNAIIELLGLIPPHTPQLLQALSAFSVDVKQ